MAQNTTAFGESTSPRLDTINIGPVNSAAGATTTTTVAIQPKGFYGTTASKINAVIRGTIAGIETGESKTAKVTTRLDGNLLDEKILDANGAFVLPAQNVDFDKTLAIEVTNDNSAEATSVTQFAVGINLGEV